MGFTREHHHVIATVLGCLEAGRLRERECLFAGGTALALRFGEYRESVDIDFVVSDADAYRELRADCHRLGFEALTVRGQGVVSAAPLRIDQYGIRTRLQVVGVPVAFEIIREARISLDPPARSDEVLGIATATFPDLMAMKLLANSDRWTDPTVFSRDILDVAMARPSRPVLVAAMAKASAAYGNDIERHARSAIAWLLGRADVLDRCREVLGMTQPRAVLVHRLRRLGASLDAIADRA